MQEIIGKIKELAKKPAFLKAAVGAGILAMILILVSDFNGGEEEQKRSDVGVTGISFTSAELYAGETEKRLCETLTEIEGVGKAKVMLTITSTEEYVYAESVKSGDSRTENSYVIIDKGSQKEALVKKINNPAISGVVIVCEGGDDPKVCERIYNAVSTALNIPTNKIYVAEMK
ncbi:MAG: hypothetical protein NC253_03940 [Ruminococcus sp.]|nr:hypothetical protein [Ruminococcus sp.]MCM1381735.1 hypothetical protein [Muribaculaceae bacterium]MCM1479856.1 hypothetical protein [Muribaculaceae bacterium]